MRFLTCIHNRLTCHHCQFDTNMHGFSSNQMKNRDRILANQRREIDCQQQTTPTRKAHSAPTPNAARDSSSSDGRPHDWKEEPPFEEEGIQALARHQEPRARHRPDPGMNRAVATAKSSWRDGKADTDRMAIACLVIDHCCLPQDDLKAEKLKGVPMAFEKDEDLPGCVLLVSLASEG